MKQRNTQLNNAAEASKRGAGAGANSTRGRARRFTDRKKEASRRACRGRVS